MNQASGTFVDTVLFHYVTPTNSLPLSGWAYKAMSEASSQALCIPFNNFPDGKVLKSNRGSPVEKLLV